MNEDGPAGDARTRLARGTTPNALTSQRAIAGSGPVLASRAPGTTGSVPDAGSGPVPAGGAHGMSAPAQSICEALEQLLEANDADEAVAEWMRGGG